MEDKAANHVEETFTLISRQIKSRYVKPTGGKKSGTKLGQGASLDDGNKGCC